MSGLTPQYKEYIEGPSLSIDFAHFKLVFYKVEDVRLFMRFPEVKWGRYDKECCTGKRFMLNPYLCTCN